MNKFIAASICLIILLLPLAFADENVKRITEKKYEVVNVKSFLNIRAGPGTIYSILRAIPSTEENITIVESKQLAKSTWVKIKHNDEYGWVNKVYLKTSAVKAQQAPEQEIVSEEEPLLWLTMSGVYSLTNIEPKKREKMDTHMLFQVESEQAKVIYDAIKTPSFTDKCTGATAKKVGEMLCLHYPPPKEKQDEITAQTDNQEKEQETKQAKNNDAAETSAVIQEIYECHFSINIMQQKIQHGIPCEE